jgi:hypothetical protein
MSTTNRTHDLFDGVFDNTATGQREVWLDGRCTRYCKRNALAPHAVWEVMRPLWGSFPDLPANAATKQSIAA